jgi:hypothetical protein
MPGTLVQKGFVTRNKASLIRKFHAARVFHTLFGARRGQEQIKGIIIIVEVLSRHSGSEGQHCGAKDH